MTLFWFGIDLTHVAYTYWIPILPLVMTWDGVVSCLRTRTCAEVLLLLRQVMSDQGLKTGGIDSAVSDENWTFSTVRQRHTWPFGYMTAVVGIRNEIRREE